MTQSLFDPVDSNVKLPDERPKRDYRKAIKFGGIIIGAIAILVGG